MHLLANCIPMSGLSDSSMEHHSDATSPWVQLGGGRAQGHLQRAPAEDGEAGHGADGVQTTPAFVPSRNQWLCRLTSEDSLSSLNYLGMEAKVCFFITF